MQHGLAQFALHRQTWYSSGVDPVRSLCTQYLTVLAVAWLAGALYACMLLVLSLPSLILFDISLVFNEVIVT